MGKKKIAGLSKVPTCELVRELRKREGVEPIIDVAPYQEVTITAKGPAIILYVID